ncbi:uncharacterized protein TNCV_733191, partial [Trichonephila clavipes]
SSSCASASSSNARELDEQILEVKINPQEKNTVSDASTNKDIYTLSKEKESENENEETKLIRNDFAHNVGTPIDADLREQILKFGPYQPEAPQKNSLAVLNHKILEVNSQVQNVKLGGHQTYPSINRLWHELCDMLRRLVGTTAPGHHDCSIQE